MASISGHHTPSGSLFAFASRAFGIRASDALDRRDLSDDLMRDLGLMDGHRAVESIRWERGVR